MKNRPNIKEDSRSGGQRFPSTSHFRLVNGFYSGIDVLRAQFEMAVSGALESKGNACPLKYAFLNSAYQFLTVGADNVFTPDMVHDLLQNLRGWALKELGVSHVSTPQLRVYVNESYRAIARDDTKAEWHYLLSLSAPSVGDWASVKILTDAEGEEGHRSIWSVSGTATVRLHFNQLLVHRSNCFYSIETIRAGSNPREGIVFLDGYLW
jgi:hypothetical protein